MEASNTITRAASTALSQTSMAASSQLSHPYLSGVLLASLSFLVMLLIIPPLLWHFRHRNIGATALIAWLVVLLMSNFVNAILWPSDDFGSWYNGVGLCDVEVKIQMASQVAFPATFACILRALAAVMDVDKATLIQTKAQRHRLYAIDLLWCLGFPLLQMLLHYIVQPHRYYIWGISGCTPAVSDSWLTIVLIQIPPALWVIIDTYFAVLILIRLYRYRFTFSSILASSNTTRSRFMRLYLICIIWVLGSVPLGIYVFYENATRQQYSYSWAETHSAKAWRQIIYVRSNGRVIYDRWCPPALGVFVFIFFGFGKEAIGMYKSYLVTIGLGRCLPNSESKDRRSVGTMLGSLNGKAQTLFRRKDTVSWTSSSSASQTKSGLEPFSPDKEVFPAAPDQHVSACPSPETDKSTSQGLFATAFARTLAVIERIRAKSVDHNAGGNSHELA